MQEVILPYQQEKDFLLAYQELSQWESVTSQPMTSDYTSHFHFPPMELVFIIPPPNFPFSSLRVSSPWFYRTWRNLYVVHRDCGEGNGTPFCTLAWKIPWMEEPGRLRSTGLLRVGHDWEISLSLFTFMHWGKKWQPTPVLLPGESQGWGSLVGWHLWGCPESDTTDVT